MSGAGDTVAAQASLHALAREAFIYALPLYEMQRMLSASSPRKRSDGAIADPSPQAGPESTWRWVNLFSHTRQLLGPANRRVVTPNNDTLYTNAWLDLSDGPLLIHAPDTGTRYYVLGLLDFWTNPFAYSGTRTTSNRAQTLFVHGPGWRGSVPKGCIVIASPTNLVWVLGRVMADVHEDMAQVHALQDQFRIEPATPPAHPSDDIGKRLNAQMAPNDMPRQARSFLRVVNSALLLNPPPLDQTEWLARFAAVGLGPGLVVPQDLSAWDGVIDAALAELDAPDTSRNKPGGWSLPIELDTSFGQDWHKRARTARGYIGALGNQEAMYIMAESDAQGQVLDGRHAYRLRFAPEQLPQVQAFWSLTMYRKADYLLVENPIGRYSIGDRTPGLAYDPDGGLTITMSAQPFADGQANWLPAPAEAFYVSLRLYLPRPAHLQRSFVYPPIQRLD